MKKGLKSRIKLKSTNFPVEEGESNRMKPQNERNAECG